MYIRTVTGDINPKNLGFTHCHEHLFTYRVEGVELEERLLLDSFNSSRSEARTFRKVGGRAILDAQPFAAGRNARLLKKLAEDTNLNIIGATGFHKSLYYPKNFWVRRAGTDEIANLFVSEIKEGMYEYDPIDPFKVRSNIKGGIIKVATGEEGLTPLYRKLFDAAAKAHRRTGAPIMTHTELSQFGQEQVEHLMKAGVRPEHIIVSHMDRVIDVERNARLAKLGVFL